MIFTILGYASLSVILTGLLFYCYRRFYAHNYFKRLGIPGPEPHWLLGNLKEFMAEGTRHLVLANWSKKYGKMYGYFEGPKPTLVISDPSMVQQVFVKQFPSFHGRKRFAFQPDPESTTEPIHMFYARGQRWKRLRTIINPTFSAGKLRAMMPLMKKCLDDFMELIDKRAAVKEEFDIFECYKFLTLDTISECAFGVELKSSKTEGRNNPILDNIKQMFAYTFKVPGVVKAAMVLPEFLKVFKTFAAVKAKIFGSGFMGPMENLLKMMDSIIRGRKTNPEKQRVDLMQMMLELEDPDAATSTKNSSANAFSLKGLTKEEIKAQAMLFMLAGYETSSNALAFTSFLLAKNPAVQEKLYKEIKEHFPDETVEANYDSVFALKYLDCVIHEALRMYPIAGTVTNRLAMEDTELAGVPLPAGLPVQLDVWSIHYDNDLYGPVDTKEFHPERFSEDYSSQPDRNVAAFLTFGLGPRICIGMRFALLEIKLALVSVLRRYRIDETPRTGDKLDLNVASTMTPKNGIWVKLSRRW